jgi:hypothetical protein
MHAVGQRVKHRAVFDDNELITVLDEAAARQKSFMVRLNLKCNLKPSLRGNIQRRIMRLLCYDSIIGSKFQAALPNAS